MMKWYGHQMAWNRPMKCCGHDLQWINDNLDDMTFTDIQIRLFSQEDADVFETQLLFYVFRAF